MFDESSQRNLKCGTHGEVAPAFVCGHLVRANPDRPLGFIEPEREPDDLDQDPQAWCASCDALLEREGEWNELAIEYADVRAVCEFCFAKLREIHDRPITSLYKE
jgi:hypothetical protein